MSQHDFFVSQSNVFSGCQKTYENADYVIVGVPFDVTSTYRTGARFGPNAIRQASLNLETYSFRTGINVEDLRLHDLGDLHISTDTKRTLQTLELVTKDTLESGKIPVTIGGEHTITLGTTRALGGKAREAAVVSFDAHLDLRNEFQSLRLSHTTFMRRISEQVKPARIIEVGTRAVCKEELDYAGKADIKYVTTQEIRKQGKQVTIKTLKAELSKQKYVYISVDMDVLDPAFVPAVQNPEPDGLDTNTLLDILGSICDKRAIAFDVVEIAPNYDQGISAVQAAKVAFEIMCNIEKSRRTCKKSIC